MQPNKHIVIFSHGFGVRKDDRGLLTDIAKEIPEVESVLLFQIFPFGNNEIKSFLQFRLTFTHDAKFGDIHKSQGYPKCRVILTTKGTFYKQAEFGLKK